MLTASIIIFILAVGMLALVETAIPKASRGAFQASLAAKASAEQYARTKQEMLESLSNKG